MHITTLASILSLQYLFLYGALLKFDNSFNTQKHMSVQ